MEALLAGTEIERQLAYERRAMQRGRDRYFAQMAKDNARGHVASNAPAQRWLSHWSIAMILAIRKQRRELKKAWGRGDPGAIKSRPVYYLVSPPKLAAIVMSEMLLACLKEPEGVTSASLFMAIGKAVIAEAQMQKWRREKAWDKFKKLYKHRRRTDLSGPDVVSYAKKIDSESIYSRELCCAVGASLTWLVVFNCSKKPPGEDFELAFHHAQHWRGRKRRGTFTLDDEVRQAIARDAQAIGRIKPVYPPMIIPPLRRSEMDRSGYPSLPFQILARSTFEQRKLLKERLPGLTTLTDGLQAMGSTPVCVDKWILGVVDRLMETGGGIAGLPMGSNLPYPPKPDGDDSAWRREAVRIRRKNIANETQFSRMHLVTETAREFAHEPKLYLEHYIDSRQRCYPRAHYFNHHGGDLERSLIRFSEPKQGENDAYHIAIQAANMYGIPRAGYRARVQWTRDNLPRIIASARDPMKEQFWTEADEPLQFLAACRALHNPEAAATLPIQRDATASGFQQYAAMTRDEAAAPLVNLEYSDEPFALYKEVADRVAADLAPNRAKIDPHILAKILDELPKQDGKLCKTPTMTKVYRVTGWGARQQLVKELTKRGFTKDEVKVAKKVIAESTLRIVGEMFPRVSSTMDWMVEQATTIAKANRLVMWEAPTGFPVLQGYRKERMARILTEFHTVNIWIDDRSMPVHIKKQANGIAANFVHSIDSSLLIMVAIEAHNRGLAFLGVHDCYWTHAATTDQLGEIARRTFANIHSESQIDRLWLYWKEQHPDLNIPPPPEKGHYDPESVIDAPYFLC